MFATKHREANQIKQWKDQLLDGVSDVFDDKPKTSKEPQIDVKSLHAKIGQLALETIFWRERSTGQVYWPLPGRRLQSDLPKGGARK